MLRKRQGTLWGNPWVQLRAQFFDSCITPANTDHIPWRDAMNMRIKVALAENLQPLKIPSLKSTAGQNKDLYALPTDMKSFFLGV